MISKTMLAANPRHRPSREALTAGWCESAVGQWMLDALAVCLEIDGLWHSYAKPVETRRNSPGFVTITDAMRDAQQRSQTLAAPA